MAERPIELELPARAEYVALARLVVSSLASAHRVLTEDRIDDLKLAVSEACTNAIEAHSAASSSGGVIVRCHELADRLEIEITDEGAGFDPEMLPEHPPVTDPERLNFERGLGIPLIRTLVDEVAFESDSSGTTVRMTVYCDAADRHEDDLFDVDVDVDIDLPDS